MKPILVTLSWCLMTCMVSSAPQSPTRPTVLSVRVRNDQLSPA